MPRVNTKTKSKAGKAYNCNKCQKPIEPGHEYYEWTFYHARPSRRHVACGRPRESELTNSKLSGAYAAVEGLQDAIAAARKANSLDGIVDEIDTAISEIEQVRDEYQEQIDSYPNLAATAEEKVGELDDFLQELEEAKGAVESAAEGDDGDADQNPVVTALDELEDKVQSACF